MVCFGQEVDAPLPFLLGRLDLLQEGVQVSRERAQQHHMHMTAAPVDLACALR